MSGRVMPASSADVPKIEFRGQFIPEPFLKFGNEAVNRDPKLGLTLHGPVSLRPGHSPTIKEVTVGIIGSGETISAARSWLARISGNVEGKAKRNFLFPGFPGFERVFGARIVVSDELDFVLREKQIADVLTKKSHNQKVAATVDLFAKGINALNETVPKPMVILCAIPRELDDICNSVTGGGPGVRLSRDEKQLKAKLVAHRQTGQSLLFAFDAEVQELLEAGVGAQFRRKLKARAMEVGVKTQICRHRTLTGEKGTQDDATRAWNFSVALYCKAGGMPWRPHKAPVGTCYIGISFFKADGKHMRASLAQVFSSTGVGLVLRGTPFEWDHSRERSPHLSEEGAHDILRDAIELYATRMGAPPTRVVVHKSSKYWKEELAGFRQATDLIPTTDFLALTRRGTRFFRRGTKSPLRGTFISLSRERHLLYTKGFVPYLDAYPGPRVPRPLEIIEHHGSTPIETIGEELMILTKLNWNTADFSTGDPITLAFANKVGDIMRELPEEVRPLSEYVYYM